MLSYPVLAVLGLSLGLWLAAGDEAAAQALPQYDGEVHLGVASCHGANCHGAKDADVEDNYNVLQNEYIKWQRDDLHARAYDVLFNKRSKRMAAALGLESAHTADLCLDCHADNVAPDKRGATFQMSDGVGCEACHGGGQRWLGPHLSRQGYAKNVAAGMYPTVEPVNRAKLCLSCHFGDATKFVTHRIYGAGHPRLRFELDTFTWIQPAHFNYDADYRKRKPQFLEGVQTWAIGQALAINSVLDGLANSKRNRDGGMPELTFFDCQACHHAMTDDRDLRWRPRSGTRLPPGVIRLTDSNLVMLRVIANHLDKGMADTLLKQTRALHRASRQGVSETAAAAKTLNATVSKFVGKLSSHKFTKSDMGALMRGLVDEGKKGEYVDFQAAEQATMALSAVVENLWASQLINQSQYDQMNTALNACYDAVQVDKSYRPAKFIQALRAVEGSIPNL